MRRDRQSSQQSKKRKILFQCILDKVNFNINFKHQPMTKEVKKNQFHQVQNQDLVKNVSSLQRRISQNKQNKKKASQRKQKQTISNQRKSLFRGSQRSHPQNSELRDALHSYQQQINFTNMQYQKKKLINKNSQLIKQIKINSFEQYFNHENALDEQSYSSESDNVFRKIPKQQSRSLSKAHGKKKNVSSMKNLVKFEFQEEDQDYQSQKMKKQYKHNRNEQQHAADQIFQSSINQSYNMNNESQNQNEFDQQILDKSRMIGVYIRKQLQSLKDGRPITFKQLLSNVLLNFQPELRTIQDQVLKKKKVECIRRRIYECISILSALGVVDKENKEIKTTDKDAFQIAKFKKQKQKLARQKSEAEMKLRYVKQKYFDLVTQLNLMKGLASRNESISKPRKVMFHLPVKVLVCDRNNLKVRTKKINNSQRINAVQIQSQKFLYPLHSIDLFIILRKYIAENNLQSLGLKQQIIKEYLACVQRQNDYQHNKKVRQQLIQKMLTRDVSKSKRKSMGGQEREKTKEKPKEKVEEEKNKKEEQEQQEWEDEEEEQENEDEDQNQNQEQEQEEEEEVEKREKKKEEEEQEQEGNIMDQIDY